MIRLLKWECWRYTVWTDYPYGGKFPVSISLSLGLLFNPCALWVGAHYSKQQRRWCINLVPMLTVWLTLPGGTEP